MTSFAVMITSLVVVTTIVLSYTTPSTAIYSRRVPVIDENGNALHRENKYIIVPATYCDDDDQMGLAIANDTQHCPLYITKQKTKLPVEEEDYYDSVIPVVKLIAGENPDDNIVTNSLTYIYFGREATPHDYPDSCEGFTGSWKMDKDDLYVTLTGKGGLNYKDLVVRFFWIEKLGHNKDDGIYVINHCAAEGGTITNPCHTLASLGLSKENGRFGVKNVVPLPVKFRLVSDYVRGPLVNLGLSTLQA